MLHFQNPNARFLVICAGICVSALGGFGWLTWSDLDLAGELVAQTESIERKVVAAEASLRSTAAREDQVLVLRERVKEYVTILPDDDEINAFVDKLTEFETASGVRVTKLDDTQARQRQSSRRKKAPQAFENITYKLRLQGTTDQLLGFMDMLENAYERFVRIPSLEITAFEDRSAGLGDGVDPLSIVRQHSVDLDLETYAYNPKRVGRGHVEIKNEARKLERLAREGRLDADASDVQVVRCDVELRPGRRDPFVDPRLVLPENSKISEAERRQQLQVLSDLKTRIGAITEAVGKEKEISNTVFRMQALERNNQDLRTLDGEVKEILEQGFFTIPDYEKEFQASVEAPLRALLDRLDRFDGGGVLGVEELESRVSQMKAASESRDWARVIELHDEIGKLRKRLEVPSALTPLIGKAEALYREASAQRSFAEMKFEFGGCVAYGDHQRRAVIIINGRSYSPGEMVAEDLVIRSITPTQVTFDFKGYVVSRRHGSEMLP